MWQVVVRACCAGGEPLQEDKLLRRRCCLNDVLRQSRSTADVTIYKTLSGLRYSNDKDDASDDSDDVVICLLIYRVFGLRESESRKCV